ncbi:MAG: type II toxin-antitoxin system RelE/ParE family toxin [Elusimicrobiales bacterium]|nr:type II toxin-antitoxin system RelE/ParE family toxin [Elusimicrobiales bacterium]
MISLKKEQTVIFEKWFAKLPSNVKEKIADYIDRFLNGNTSCCEPVGEGISEIKVNYQKGYRVYYTVINGRTVLLLICGGDKKSQPDDIKRAKKIKRMLEV